MTTIASHVRVRFAPAPTGNLHVGGLRTALFNLLFARKHGGTFLLRIEDTDIERSQEVYTRAILDALAWCDITPDEPFLIQSTRIAQHRAVVEQLIAQERAYRCYCTQEEVQARCQIGTSEEGAVVKYDGLCWNIRAEKKDAPYAIRFRLPQGQKTLTFHDLIRGDIVFDLGEFDDFIIVRSDGTPMYNFVVVIDDAYMRISHIIRGEEHISNTPKQILLYQACEYTVPQFAHLPMILGPDGSKLSKRDAATGVNEYIDGGFLSDALINYLVRLGWGHGDQEIFSRAQMIQYFSLEAVAKKGAIFDSEKLRWMNSIYIKMRNGHQLFEDIQVFMPHFAGYVSGFSLSQIIATLELYKERVHTLRELAHEVIALMQDPDHYELLPENLPLHAGQNIYDILMSTPEWHHDILAQRVKEWCKEQKIKMGSVAQLLRVALIGKISGPGVFDIMTILGRSTVAQRIQKYLQLRRQIKNS